MRIYFTILLLVQNFFAFAQPIRFPMYPTGATAIVYATYNPLDKGSLIPAPTNGNLTEAPQGRGQIRSTRFCATGTKHIWEVMPTISGTGIMIGIATSTADLEKYTGQETVSYGWNNPGGVYNNAGIITMSGVTYTTNDTILVALDGVGNTLKFYKAGTLQGTATITGGLNYYASDGSPSAGSGSYTTANYGQNAWSSGNAAARATLIAAGYLLGIY